MNYFKLFFLYALLAWIDLSFSCQCSQNVPIPDELEYMTGLNLLGRSYHSFEHEMILSTHMLKEIKLLLQEVNPELIKEIGTFNPQRDARSPDPEHYVSLEVKKKIKDCLGRHVFCMKIKLF